jgi:hypothetical protein
MGKLISGIILGNEKLLTWWGAFLWVRKYMFLKTRCF